MQKYDGQLFRQFENPTYGIAANGVTIEIRNFSDNSMAAIFANYTGTISKTNPVVSDTNGYYWFYAEDGRYRLIFSDGRPEIEIILRETAISESSRKTVKDFGAKGDGLTDDTAAFQAAFALSNQAPVIAPAGSYIITSNLTASNRLVIIGDGSTLTTITFKNGSRIAYSPGTQEEYGTHAQLGVYGITFLTETTNSETCIQASWSAGVGGTSSTVAIKDCNFSGTTPTKGWLYALDFENARNTYFENIRIIGDRNNTPVQATGGIRLRGALSGTEHFLHGIRIFFVNNALVVNQTVEGVYLTSCSFLRVNTGVLGDSQATGAMEPLISISGCHFNVYGFGVYLKNYVQSIVKGCLVYNQPDGTSFGLATATGIYIENNSTFISSDVIVSDNIFRKTPTDPQPPSVGCYIVGGSNYDVSHNNFASYDQAIYLQDGVTPVSGYTITDNTYTNCPIKITSSGTGFAKAKERKTPASFSQVLTMPATGTSEFFFINIPKGTSSVKPESVALTPSSEPDGISFWYDYDQSTPGYLLIRAVGPMSSQSIRLSIFLS